MIYNQTSNALAQTQNRGNFNNDFNATNRLNTLPNTLNNNGIDAFNANRSFDINSLLQLLISLLLSRFNGQNPGGGTGNTAPDIPEVSGDQSDFFAEQPFNGIGESTTPPIFLSPEQTFSLRANGLSGVGSVIPGSGVGGSHIISNQAQLESFARTVGIPLSQLPNVDFSQTALIYETNNTGQFGFPESLDPPIGRINDRGILGTARFVNLGGFIPTNQERLDFFPVDRRGINGFASSNPSGSNPAASAILGA